MDGNGLGDSGRDRRARVAEVIEMLEDTPMPTIYLGLAFTAAQLLRELINEAKEDADMAIKRYTVATPKQLGELYAIRAQGNASMDNLTRVWRAHNVLESCNYAITPTRDLAYVEFDGKARTATVYKDIHGNVGEIGRLPYNKALGYCRENLYRQTEVE